MVRWVVFECNSMSLVCYDSRIKKKFIFFPGGAFRNVEPQSTARIGVSKGSHHGIPCPASGIAADNNGALDDFARGVIQLPKGLVFTGAQTLLGFVGGITDGRAVRRVVPIRNVPLREGGPEENRIFDEGPATIPYYSLQ